MVSSVEKETEESRTNEDKQTDTHTPQPFQFLRSSPNYSNYKLLLLKLFSFPAKAGQKSISSQTGSLLQSVQLGQNPNKKCKKNVLKPQSILKRQIF